MRTNGVGNACKNNPRSDPRVFRYFTAFSAKFMPLSSRGVSNGWNGPKCKVQCPFLRIQVLDYTSATRSARLSRLVCLRLVLARPKLW
jgi:hypothetical protein